MSTRHALGRTSPDARLLTGSAASTPAIETASVHLVVTSPPFLDVVDYAADNWLRCWFCGIDPSVVEVRGLKRLEAWQQFVTDTFLELRRLLRPGGHVSFEVGEVRGGSVQLEQAVVSCAVAAGLEPRLVLINTQEFTKTAQLLGCHEQPEGDQQQPDRPSSARA